MRFLSEEGCSTDSSSSPLRRRELLLIIVAAGLLGLVYNFVIMLGFGPDEPRHMAYVRLLLDERRLPFLTAGGSEYAGAHSLHPPLYYLLLLPFYALTRGLPGEWEWHVLRVLSLVLCLASLPLIYQIAQKIARRIGVESTTVSLLAVAQVALLPMFGMTSGIINNDSAALFCTVLFVWLLAVKFPTDGSFRSAMWIGTCFGAGALTKASVPLCTAIALLIYFCFQWRDNVSPSSRVLQRLALTIIVGGLVASPWYVRNSMMYGKAIPVASGYTVPVLPSPEQGILTMMLHDNFPRTFAYANWSMFYTMWSQKDWIPENMRDVIYLVIAAWSAMALLGIVYLRERKKKVEYAVAESPTDQEPSNAPSTDATVINQIDKPLAGSIALWCSAGAFAINWLACLWTALFVHWGWAEGGRYILPSLFGFSLLVAFGWQTLLKQRLSSALIFWTIAMLALNFIAIAHLLIVLNPKYG